MEPRWYHSNGRGRGYTGDRHPETHGTAYATAVYEPALRACDNCGTVTRVFTKEYRDLWAWHDS